MPIFFEPPNRLEAQQATLCAPLCHRGHPLHDSEIISQEISSHSEQYRVTVVYEALCAKGGNMQVTTGSTITRPPQAVKLQEKSACLIVDSVHSPSSDCAGEAMKTYLYARVTTPCQDTKNACGLRMQQGVFESSSCRPWPPRMCAALSFAAPCNCWTTSDYGLIWFSAYLQPHVVCIIFAAVPP
jgi:hypothetical protein